MVMLIVYFIIIFLNKHILKTKARNIKQTIFLKDRKSYFKHAFFHSKAFKHEQDSYLNNFLAKKNQCKFFSLSINQPSSHEPTLPNQLNNKKPILQTAINYRIYSVHIGPSLKPKSILTRDEWRKKHIHFYLQQYATRRFIY